VNSIAVRLRVYTIDLFGLKVSLTPGFSLGNLQMLVSSTGPSRFNGFIHAALSFLAHTQAEGMFFDDEAAATNENR
jgi:hypothetical protein